MFPVTPVVSTPIKHPLVKETSRGREGNHRRILPARFDVARDPLFPLFLLVASLRIFVVSPSFSPSLSFLAIFSLSLSFSPLRGQGNGDETRDLARRLKINAVRALEILNSLGLNAEFDKCAPFRVRVLNIYIYI